MYINYDHDSHRSASWAQGEKNSPSRTSNVPTCLYYRGIQKHKTKKRKKKCIESQNRSQKQGCTYVYIYCLQHKGNAYKNTKVVAIPRVSVLLVGYVSWGIHQGTRPGCLTRRVHTRSFSPTKKRLSLSSHTPLHRIGPYFTKHNERHALRSVLPRNDVFRHDFQIS